MINPPSTFGQPSEPAVTTAPEPEPAGRGPRTVVIAVAAGVVALGVLGGAAALVLTGGDGSGELAAAPPPAAVVPVEPSASATVSTPLPTSAVLGRNVFVPLVDAASEAGAGEDAPGGAGAAPSALPTPEPTTAAPVAPPPPPAPAVTQVVQVPGPTTVVTQPVPGPTVTTGPTQTVDRFAHQVEVVAVEPLLDEAGAPVPNAEGQPDSRATYRVNGTEYVVQEGEVFLDLFTHVDLEAGGEDGDQDIAVFTYASSLWAVSVGTTLGLGPR